MNDIVLSVCVITYNQEQYISQTLDSILSQEHNYNYEIVIGEDCSVDNTRKIIEKYTANYPNIIKPIYNSKNLGLIRNYFNVISNCSGKYIMECAGDDWWLEGKVKKQIDYMESHPDVGMCYGKVRDYDENGMFLGTVGGKSCTQFEQLLSCDDIPAVTVCFRKAIFEKYMKDVSPETKSWRMEDYPAWLWMSKNSKIVFLDSFIAAYRHTSESISRTNDVDKELLFEESNYQVRKYFSEKYDVELPPFNSAEFRQMLLYKRVLNSYDKTQAEELKKSLVLNNFKNILKYIMLSSESLIKLYSIIRKM